MSTTLSQFARVPEDLITLPRWVCWRREMRGDKSTKVPYTPSGRRASSTAPETWSDYSTVLEAYAQGGFAGIGFMLGDGWAGVDLDKCIDERGIISEQALLILAALPGAYIEVSPSKTGVKAIVRGELPPGRRRIGSIEMYSRARFFTVTGADAWEVPL